MKNNKSSSKILKNEYDAWRGKIIFTTFYSKSLFFLSFYPQHLHFLSH